MELYLKDFKSKIEEISSLLDSYKESGSESTKCDIINIVETEFSSLQNEIIAVKKRLITPDISLDALVSQVVEMMKVTSIDFDTTLFSVVLIQLQDPQSNHDIINGEIRLIAGQTIQNLSEDNLWYLANTAQPSKNEPISDVDFLTELLISSTKKDCKEYLIETKQLDRNFDDLKSMAIEFLNSNKIASDNIYQWLEKKLYDNRKLDRVTHGIVTNMMSSILEKFSPESIENIYKNELFIDENSHFIPNEYSFDDGSEKAEVIIETLKRYIFFTIINQEV